MTIENDFSIGADRLLSRVLDVNGDGTGSQEQAVNGSSTPVKFYVTPSSTKLFMVYTFGVNIICASAVDSLVQYGDIAALTTGIEIKVLAGSDVIKNFTSVNKIQDNADLFFFGADASMMGNRNDPNAISGFSNLLEVYGIPIRLDGSKSEKLEITINDNLAGITSQEMEVTGRRFTV